MIDPTNRFSSRVENYVKYRPSYPPQIISVLRDECGLTDQSVVADIGSGTGIFSDLLLQGGNAVFAVEPNPAMRASAEHSLRDRSRFTSVAGTAEATTLADASVDLITAAQAFHWFDRPKTRMEFMRILKRSGWVALIWNDRQLDSTPFLRDYEQLLQTYGTDYLAVRHQDLDLDQVKAFIGSDAVSKTVLANVQVLDFDGIKGRLLSSSYAPEAGHPNHVPMLTHLEALFDRHAVDHKVELIYDTQIYCGQFPDR